MRVDLLLPFSSHLQCRALLVILVLGVLSSKGVG